MSRDDDHRVDAAARLMERLLDDRAFRAAFRRRPADAARAFGFGHLARELEGSRRAVQTLDARESRSALAGALWAAAAEGVSMADLVQHAEGRGSDAGTRAIQRLATRRGAADVVAEGAADGDAVYPGDDAPREQIAAWMAAEARRAGLPGVLPVMAALQESGLRNLPGGDRDSVGYFQMRLQFWNTGRWHGYPDKPELQLRWFIETALEVRREHPGSYRGPDDYGRWIADVERCAEENRGLYQQHLAQARRLIAAGGDASAASQPQEHATAQTAPRRSRPSHGTQRAPVVRAMALPVIRDTQRVAVVPAPDPEPAARPANGGESAGERMVGIAEDEVGETEVTTNESPRIAEYREATVGSYAGAPWCAYFVSWVAREAGVPLGDDGQGFGAVDDVWAWAQGEGRAVRVGEGAPEPGDLILWRVGLPGQQHIGIVKRVLPDGRIQTIEGNSGDHVASNVYAPGDAYGYVRMP